MLLLPVKGFELWKSVWAGWLSLGVTWLVSGGHQLLINARLNADLRYHLLLWLLCNYAREVTSLSVVAIMLLYNVSNITLTSKGRTSYRKLHGYNKNWYHLCPGYHSTVPNQQCRISHYFFPIRTVGRGTTGERGGGRVEGADDLRMYWAGGRL